MGRPLAAAIRNLLVLGGLVDLQKFRSPVRGLKRAKNAQKVDFPGLGGRSGRDAC